MTNIDERLIQTPWGKKRWGLIKAAFEAQNREPELLAALEAISNAMSSYMNARDTLSHVSWLTRTAIAKARGHDAG